MAETSNRKTYHEQTYIDNTLRLREILKTLPPFAKVLFSCRGTNDICADQDFLCL